VVCDDRDPSSVGGGERSLSREGEREYETRLDSVAVETERRRPRPASRFLSIARDRRSSLRGTSLLRFLSSPDSQSATDLDSCRDMLCLEESRTGGALAGDRLELRPLVLEFWMPDLGGDVADPVGENEIAVVGGCAGWRLDRERGLLLLDVAGVAEYAELDELLEAFVLVRSTVAGRPKGTSSKLGFPVTNCGGEAIFTDFLDLCRAGCSCGCAGFID
jgi:hypothetical protein